MEKHTRTRLISKMLPIWLLAYTTQSLRHKVSRILRMQKWKEKQTKPNPLASHASNSSFGKAYRNYIDFDFLILIYFMWKLSHPAEATVGWRRERARSHAVDREHELLDWSARRPKKGQSREWKRFRLSSGDASVRFPSRASLNGSKTVLIIEILLRKARKSERNLPSPSVAHFSLSHSVSLCVASRGFSATNFFPS